MSHYTLPPLNNSLRYKERRIDRNYVIWQLSKRGMHQYKIGEVVGCSQSVVCQTMATLRILGSDRHDYENAVTEYFLIGFDLSDIFEEEGVNPDKYVTNILNSLWRYNLLSKNKIASLGQKDIDVLLKVHCMKRAGQFACGIFQKYYNQLKYEKELYNHGEESESREEALA